MKKLFVSIMALAALAACQSDFSDVNLDAPQGGNANVGGSHTIYAEVGVGEDDTKATYGDGLKATWEENDQIALLQEHANYGATFGVVNKLNIKDGWGTSKALFNGEISVDATEPRVYHIAYPASAVSFNTASELSLVGSVTYENNSPIAGYQLKAHGTYNYIYNSTLNIIVPTTQNGKWEPYMYASTSEAVDANAIGAKTLNTLTGAIAIRAFEADGVTPKQLKQIVIKSNDVAIAGAFSGTAQSVGSLGEVVGDETAWHTAFEEESAKSKALASLESKVKAMVPATVSQTKALSLSFAGSQKTITATNLDAIASEADGKYTYYINVAPATLAAGSLTIEATDVDGSTLTRVVNKEVTIAASHRAGFNLTWEDATLNGATIETWYNNWNTGSHFQLEGSTIYVDNVSVDGNVAADHVLAIGVKINGTFHEASQQSGVLAISPIVISGLSSGVYKVQPVAKVLINGEEKWLECAEVEKTVTSIPQVIDYSVRTSYSSNGNLAKTNDINGDILRVKANISDSYVANNLVNGKTYTFCYGSNTVTQTLGAEKELTLAHDAWGQYVCYVKIALANGYTCESTKYTTHVTGIPYSVAMQDHSNDASSKWTSYNCSYKTYFIDLLKSANNNGYIISPKFSCPDCNVVYTVAAKYYKGAGVGSSYNSATVYVGATSNTSTANKSANNHSISGTVDTNAKGFTTVSGSITLSPSNPYMSISHNNPKRYSLSPNGYLGVRNITINYSL